MVMLSIIIPIYNMEQYLPKCLQSLERQNFVEEVEIILVDDGSTDNSLNICQEAASRERYYRVIHQENQGVSVARNTGLSKAIGTYIAWVDPDDYITDDWYSVIKKELESSPDMIFFDMYMLRDQKLQEVNFEKHSRILSKQELFEELAVGNRIQSQLWSKIIRRKFFDRQFSLKLSYCEDFAILHYVCWHVNTCKYIHKPLYVYRQVENSITHEKYKMLDNALTAINLYKKRYRFYKKMGLQVPKTGIYLAMLCFCNGYAISRDKQDVKYDKIYSLCFAISKRNAYQLLLSKHVDILRKIKICFILMMGSKVYRIIKRIR